MVETVETEMKYLRESEKRTIINKLKNETSLSKANSKKDLEDEGVIVKLPVYAV